MGVLKRFLIAGIALVGIGASVGCNHDQKEADNLISENDTKVAQMNQNAEYLRTTYRILLDPADPTVTPYLVENYDFKSLSPQQLTDIRSRLMLQMSLAARIKEIGHHKNIVVKSDNGGSERSAQNAKRYLDKLTAFEQGQFQQESVGTTRKPRYQNTSLEEGSQKDYQDVSGEDDDEPR